MGEIEFLKSFGGKINRLALVGFRATGKSTVAKRMSELLGWSFMDMDELFVKSAGMSISDWVSLNGWRAFRAKESELLRDISRGDSLVVATGGGIVEMECNRKLLSEKFFVVWLDASVETIVERIKSDKNSSVNRPPLMGSDSLIEIPEIMEKREALYRSVSNARILTDEISPNQISELIYRGIRKYI